MKYASIYTLLAVLGGTLLMASSDYLETVSIGTALVIRHAGEQGHVRRLLDFQAYCDALEEAGAGPVSLSCVCDADNLTVKCDSSSYCSQDVCATFQVAIQFANEYEMDTMVTCASYSEQNEDYRDGCVFFSLDGNSNIDACALYFLDDNGVETDCNSCKVCNGNVEDAQFDIDCSNIEEDAATDGCVRFDSDEELFPGFSSSMRGGLGVVGGLLVAMLFFGMH
jgi:hypothetical protein